MSEKNTNRNCRFVTAEAVRAGHPDKFCDQLADRLLDEHLRGDPDTRAAIEVMAAGGRILVAGEVTSKASVDVERVLKQLCAEVGYTMDELSTDGSLSLEVRLNSQSPDIAQAVGEGDKLGAGDQGIMVGYATDETPERMPLPVLLAQKLCRKLDESRLPRLKPDGKAQVTVLYQDDVPVAVSAVVVSVQHDADVSVETIRKTVKEEVIRKVIPEKYLRPGTRLLINPSGRFVLGGPAADTGLTGRKLAVDACPGCRQTCRKRGAHRRREFFGKGQHQGRPHRRVCRALGGQKHRERRIGEALRGAARLRHRQGTARERGGRDLRHRDCAR